MACSLEAQKQRLDGDRPEVEADGNDVVAHWMEEIHNCEDDIARYKPDIDALQKDVRLWSSCMSSLLDQV